MRLDEVNWAKHLPYDRGTEDEDFERDLLAQFKLYALSNDFSAMTALLSQFESNYSAISLPKRIHIYRILYELITTQPLDIAQFGTCCAALARMLRKETKLSVDDLTFDWRKLYDLTKSLAFPKLWQDNLVQQRSKLKSIVEVICVASRFFPPASANEVFEELLPQIQFNSMDWQLPIVQMLNLFVPTARFLKAPKADDDEGPQKWLPTIFSLWSFNLRNSGYDAYFMNLVTTLSIEHTGHFRFTKEQIRFTFASGLHFFNLPVARGTAPLPRSSGIPLADSSQFYRLPQNGSLPLSEERAHTFARFIVYTMYGEDAGGTLELFEQLVQMIEPFYHPSNNGNWSGILSRFLRHLGKELLQRVKAENADDCTTPKNMRLTRRMRRRFVVSARTLAMLLLFSKGEDSVSMSHSTLKHLAEIEPDLIFGPLLDTLYTAIDSVTETHRMISAMRALAKLSSTLSNFELYPEGAQHVAPLLVLTLPGIDVNDQTKTLFALKFICNLCLNGVVFRELPALGDMPTPLGRDFDTATNEDLEVDIVPEPDMERVEWMIRASTAQFEAWIDQYLRRIFVLVDNMSSSLDSGDPFSSSSSSDFGVHSMISYTTELMLLQCSEQYYPMIIRLITNFATSISGLSAVDGMCHVIKAYTKALPEQALSSLVPICCERIAEEISNGVGAMASMSKRTQSHSETTLVWYVSILSTLTDCHGGVQLVKYKDMIRTTISLLLEKCLSRHIYTIACKTLNNVMCSLTRVYPNFWRSVSSEQWKNPEFQENHFRYWGQHALIDDEKFALEWHVPSQPEISCAMELMRDIIVPHVKALNELLDQRRKSPGSSADNVRMNRLLMVLIYGVRSLGLLVMPPGTQIPASELGSAIVEGDECSNMPPRYLLDRQVAAGYIFAEGTPEYFEIVELREAISRVTARTLEFMAKSGEDDVENIKVLLFLTHSCMCHFGVDRITHSQVRRGWNFGLDNFSINNDACAMPRVFAVRRIMFEQSSRMLHNTRFSQASPLANEIAGLLAHFCLSQYAEVRTHAVSVLDNVVSILPALKYPLIPGFLAELGASESSDPERMSGALRVLDTLPLRKACLRDWRFFPDLVLALCRAQHEDKPQVKKLVRSTAVSQVVHVSSPQPPHELSESTRKLVLSLGGPDPDEAAVLQLKQEGQQNYSLASTENARLVDSLVDILRNAGTTWRFAAIAGYYLERLTSVNTAPAPRVFATMADNLTSDIVLFRDSAALSLAQLLSRIRHRSKVGSAFRTVKAPTPGPAYTDMCERALAGDEAALQAPFLDSPSAGWFAWPQKVKLYSPPPPGAPAAFENIDSESQDAYDAVRTIMFSKGKWDRIAHLFSLESSRDTDHDSFGSSRASLYTQLFSLFGLPLLEHAWPAIEQLAQDIERTGAQRAAAEIIAGIIRGSKHWGRDALARMWELLNPIFALVLSRLRPNTLRLWHICLQFAFARRDPRRFLPLIKYLLYSNAFDPHADAPFLEATKLELICIMLSCWDWRVASAVVSSRPRFMEGLAHPYKQVRDVVGVVMYTLFSSEFSVSYNNVQTALEDLARYGSTGRDFSHWSGTDRTQTLIQDMVTQINEWKPNHIPSNEGTSNYSRGSKTLLTFFFSGFGFSSRRLAIGHISSIMPLFSLLQEQHDDEDVARLATGVMQFFSQILYSAQVSEGVASKILSLLDDSSTMWHVVTNTLPLLCTLTFSNRFTLPHDVRMHIVDTAAAFLEHDQIEVRHSASTSMASLIKCASSQVITDINSKFSAKLTMRLPRVRHGKPPKNPATYAKLVLTRHAGALGLSCLVLAFPYNIPDWMPEVLVLLANCIDDPNPIQSTVQRTFAEFRRTHMDTWHKDRKRFSFAQLEILTDMLVSPCYYA